MKTAELTIPGCEGPRLAYWMGADEDRRLGIYNLVAPCPWGDYATKHVYVVRRGKRPLELLLLTVFWMN